MIHLQGQLPFKVHLAFSGGVDSLAAAHFLKRGGRDVTLLHFNHGCEHSDLIERQCRQKAVILKCPIEVRRIADANVPPGDSVEAYWRQERYKFLSIFDADPVITCHHLDDAVETWVWSCLHGEGKLINYTMGNFIRPFLLTEKSEFEWYAEKNGLKPVDDPYNREGHLIRNYIRSNLLPHAYYVNPGLKKVIRKKYLNHE